MSQPFVGEIRMFAGNFPPNGWAFCNGAIQAISENETLFQLIGTTYGGDGQSTFALPDLQSRVPIHMGTGSFGTTYAIGESGGVEEVTLTTSQIPIHNHTLNATATGQVLAPSSSTVLATATSSQVGVMPYTTAAGDGTLLKSDSIGTAGGSQPHTNIQPILAINFIISLFGVFPSQN